MAKVKVYRFRTYDAAKDDWFVSTPHGNAGGNRIIEDTGIGGANVKVKVGQWQLIWKRHGR
jgi:hypothetical protein